MNSFESTALAKIPGIRFGFGTLHEPIPQGLQGFWDAKASLRQVHGAHLVELIEPRQNAENADGFYTRVAGIPCAVMTADCVPILLARKDGKAIAAIHAGWRGTKARILKALWARLSSEGERPRDWVGLIGPAIGPCCYEVSEEFAAEFNTEFRTLMPEMSLPKSRYLNLPAINAAELKEIGLSEVRVLPYCTRCYLGADERPAFNSYRRDRGLGRQYSGLLIIPA